MTDDQGYLQKLLTEIKGETKQLALMEVCGTHTMAIARSGVRELVPPMSNCYPDPVVRFVSRPRGISMRSWRW